MRAFSHTLAFVAALILGFGPYYAALAGPRDAVRAEKRDPYPAAPTVLDFARGVYKVNGQRFASFKAINGEGAWVDSVERAPGGNFASADNWTLDGAAVSGGKLVIGNTGGVAKVVATNTTPAVVGRTYQVTFTLEQVSGSGVSVYIGGVPSTVFMTPGTYSYTLTATGTQGTQVVARGPSGVTSATVDNVSVREVVNTPAPELVTNGGFDSSAGWTVGSNITISGGVATFTGPTGYLEWALSTTPGRTYVVAATSSNPIFGGAWAAPGRQSLLSGSATTRSGTFSFTFTATDALSHIEFSVGGASTVTLDNFSVREVVPVASVSRASEGYAQASDGTWRRFGPNEARITDLGLLVEEARTNLLPYAQDLENAAWFKQNVTVGANVTAAPDGTLSADSLNIPAASALFAIYDQTGAAWIKTETAIAPALTSAWQRFSWTFTAPTGSTQVRAYPIRTAAGGQYAYQVVAVTAGQTYTLSWFAKTNDAGSVVYVWGAQVELGAFATSPIVTVGAQATRAADSVRVSGLFNPASAGTLAVTFRPLAIGGSRRVIGSDGAVDVAPLSMTLESNRAETWNGSVNLTKTGTITAGGRNRIAAAWDAAGRSVTVNGATASTDAVAFGSFSSVYLGGDDSGAPSTTLNGWLENVVAYPSRKTETEIRDFTAPSVPLAANDNRALWEAA